MRAIRPYRGPIRGEEGYQACLAALRMLMDDGREMGDLPDLIAEYEEMFHPVYPPTCVAAIRFRLEQMGLRQSALARIVGGSGKASEIMSGKIEPSKAHMRAIHETFGIPYEILMNHGQEQAAHDPRDPERA